MMWLNSISSLKKYKVFLHSKVEFSREPFITIFSLWVVRIPVAYYLTDFLAEKGVWWSIPIGWAKGATFSTLYFFSGRWKTKGVVKRK